jgi:hypothetical protein
MSGIKISALPAIVAPAVGDVFPVVQGGVTYQETCTQLITLVAANIGSSGTGNFARVNTPTFVTPILGAASATSLAFSPTTSGIIGTTTNDDAAAGKVGEYISSTVLVAGAVALASTTAANVTSISLTAGDWDVFGNVSFISQVATVAASFACWISTTSATLPDIALVTAVSGYTHTGVADPFSAGVPTKRISINGTTTVYLSAEADFAAGTMKACGVIQARRVR